jgi:hypothetical protein
VAKSATHSHGSCHDDDALGQIVDELLRRILAENLTPSDSIKTPDRLFGREKTLTFYEPGAVHRGRDEINRIAGVIRATHPTPC